MKTMQTDEIVSICALMLFGQILSRFAVVISMYLALIPFPVFFRQEHAIVHMQCDTGMIEYGLG